MMKKIREFRFWLLSNPYRAAIAGFGWFTPGFWIYSLLLRPEKFLQNITNEVLLSIALGIVFAGIMFLVAKVKGAGAPTARDF